MTDDLTQRIESFTDDLHTITKTHGGILRCTVCGNEDAVDSRYWRIGWPKCCGLTMRWITQRQLDDGEAS